MEGKLRTLFDYLKFQGNKRLERLIAQAEQSADEALDDEALTFVAAAGEPSLPKKEDACHGA